MKMRSKFIGVFFLGLLFVTTVYGCINGKHGQHGRNGCNGYRSGGNGGDGVDVE